MPEPDRELDLFFERVVEGRVSRRELVKRLGAAGLTLSSAGTLLAACGGVEGTDKGGPTKSSASHPKVAIKELDFSNWPLYIDRAVLKDFEKQYPGSNVKYTEEINDNEEFFGKVRQQLQRGDSLNRDIVALTDWMAARWVAAGWVEPKDKKNIPNEKNLVANLQHPLWDPKRQFSLPRASGLLADGYKPAHNGPKLTSNGEPLDPDVKGKDK